MNGRGAVIAGLGEVLWDCFPDGRRLGGAPANFAFHATQLGNRGLVVSRIGEDAAGHGISGTLGERGVDAHLQRDSVHPTGTVAIQLKESEPVYTITEDVAWDYLSWSDDLARIASECDAAAFGTLAQRSPVSRETIRRFVKNMPARALKLFDVNLRQTYYDEASLRFGLENATVLKLNASELRILAALFGWPAEPPLAARAIFSAFPCQVVAVTLGAGGCLLFSRTETARSRPPAIRLKDSVGAGDAFAAALVSGLIEAIPLAAIADQAVRIGAFVASEAGAMPGLPLGIHL